MRTGQLTRLLAILAILSVSCVVGLGMLYAWYVWGDDLPPASKIEKSITEDIHPGATLEEIQQYLDAEGIEHGPPVAKASQFSDLEEKYGLSPDTPVYTAVMRGSRLSAISILFVLDEQLRFKRLIVIYHPPL